MADFERLSPNFTLAEAIHSQEATRRGIDNQPAEIDLLERMRRTAEQMEMVRLLLGEQPIIVSSWYRCPEVNAAVGGAPDSAHLSGQAVDFLCPSFGSPTKICRHLVTHWIGTQIRIDQVIDEGGWVHLGFFGKERREVLTAVFVPGQQTQYLKGLKA